MGTAGTVLKNATWLTIGDKVGYALQFVFFLYFAKQYGVVPAGEYSFAFMFTYAFACFADLGASLYLLREVGRDPTRDRTLFFDCLVIRSLSLLVVSLIAAAAVFYTQGGSSVQKVHLIACLGVYWLSYCLADLILAELNGHSKSVPVALLSIWLRFMSAAAGIVLIRLGMAYDLVMVVFPLSALIYLCTCLVVSARLVGPIQVQFRSMKHYGRLFATLAPFYVSVLLLELLSCEDVLILGYLRDDRAVGIYSSAIKIVTFIAGVSTFVAVSILPLLARLFAESKERLMVVSERILRYMILAGLPVSVGLAFTSSRIISLLYNDSFQEASLVLCVAGWSIAAVFAQTIFAALLTAVDRQKEKMIATAINLAVATALYIVLIQKFSSAGAAAAKALASGVSVLCFYWFVSRYLQRIRILTLLIKPALACLAMAVFLHYCRAWNILYLIPAAAGVYAAGLLALGEIRQDDIGYIKELMPKTFTAGD